MIQKNQIIHISIIDDNPLFAEGIKSILNEDSLFNIVESTDSINSLLQTAEDRLDMLIINQEFFEANKNEKIQQLINRFPDAEMVLFISDMEKLDFIQAMKGHVLGFLDHEIDGGFLKDALKIVHQGQYWFSPNILQVFITTFKQEIEKPKEPPVPVIEMPPKHLVSPREYEVLKYLAKGYDNKEIASAMSINESTVKNHVANLFDKNNVNARTPLVIKAIKNNWLQINEESMGNGSDKIRDD